MPKARDEETLRSARVDDSSRATQDDERVMNLVELALSQPPDAREDYLRSACSGDPELFSQVWDYVQWNHRMQGFLLEPLYPGLREHQFQPGELLADRFRIVREVAEGGMGIVYEAHDERLGRRIALKCAKSGFRKRLPPEVRHASEISHPNVCKIFEIHTASTPTGEIDFLTMEFLEGETLAARLTREPLPATEARAIGRQICAGLAEAHRHRVVHGDLKSNNVILAQDEDGEVRAVVTDFGLARKPFVTAGDFGPAAAGSAATSSAASNAVASSATLSSTAGSSALSSEAGGTPDYMAPELWKGEKPSPASDVYALGVILYELAANRRPYAHEVPWQDRLKHKPPPVHHGWDSILQRCLDPDPAKRFQDANEVAAALEPSHSRRWWLAAAAAVVLAAVSGVVTYQRATAPKESIRLAVLPLESAPNDAGLAESVSRDAAAALARLKGGTRARLSIVPPGDVTKNKVDSVEKARAMLSATHVLRGTITVENGKVLVHAFLTDTRTQANNADWKAEYAPGEVRYAPVAMAGMVTFSLRLPPLAIPAVNAAANQNYLAGMAYTRRNSTIDKALPLLQSAVAADPDSPLTWAGLSEAQWFKYFITKDSAWLDRSTESHRQAQGRDLDLASVHRVTGLLVANEGFYDWAEAEYLRAIELEPANGDAYRRLAHVYESKNSMDQALAVLKKAADVAPNDFKVYQDLGAYYAQRGDNLEAARQLETCVRLAPDEPDPHRVLGMAYKDLRQYADAERELGIAVGLAETPAALVSLAAALLWQGKDDKDQAAIPFLARAVSQSPDDSLSWMDLGIAYRRVNQPAESGRALRHGLDQAVKEMERDPYNGVVRSRVAFLHARLGERDQAEQEIRQALKESESSVTRGMAVWTYEALGRREEALNILGMSSDDVLMDAARWPDLAELHQDDRFKKLLASHQIKE
jgi:tetratricopeptide (TPR) repeat protein/TolB-like protein